MKKKNGFPLKKKTLGVTDCDYLFADHRKAPII